ncbi:MAG: GumC family protein [Bdellovibrionales bacterium]
MNWSRYKASATVEVARPQISLEALQTNAGSMVSAEAMADLKISRLKQTVFSTASLAEIIAKLDLYSGARETTPIAYIAQSMRSKINVSLVSTSLANPASASKATAGQLSAIAFVISFEYSEPLKAQKTVNELVTRFLDQDLKQRRKIAQDTSEFLKGQIDSLEVKLKAQEKKIADFRAENGEIRPDALAFNQQASITTTSRLLAIESELVSNLGVIGALRAQLAQVEPYALVLDQSGEVLTTPSIQLRVLKSDFAALSSKYGPRHPDVLKTRRQIDALEGQLGQSSNSARLKARIQDAETRLQSSEKAYGSTHPDVVSLQNQLLKFKGQLKLSQNGVGQSRSLTGVKKDADNPAYLNIVAQIEAAQQQQIALETQRDEIKKQQQDFNEAIAANPITEQKFAALTRDYENMLLLYRELTAKKLSSDMNKTIEEGHSGHRLAVINPPELPRGTTPARKLIFVAGFLFSFMAAAGSILALQLLSNNVIGPKHLEDITGVAPLVIVPRLYSYDEKIQFVSYARKMVGIVPVLIVLVVMFFFTVVMPFDVFTSVASRNVGL